VTVATEHEELELELLEEVDCEDFEGSLFSFSGGGSSIGGSGAVTR
jgi:hypothetical protein